MRILCDASSHPLQRPRSDRHAEDLHEAHAEPDEREEEGHAPAVRRFAESPRFRFDEDHRHDGWHDGTEDQNPESHPIETFAFAESRPSARRDEWIDPRPDLGDGSSLEASD